VPPQGGPNPFCPLDVDGDFGPNTIKALQRRVSVSQSGVRGRETTRGLQRMLNANTF
jgi:hypothetical protein